MQSFKPVVQITPRSFNRFIFISLTLLGLSISSVNASMLLSEDFEDGSLDPLISLQNLNLNSGGSGIENSTFFGSTKAFGFGRSTCGFNCFNNHTSSLFITFPTEVFVHEISFKFAELFSNWGSNGKIYLDGVAFSAGRDFQGIPSNGRIPDATFSEGLYLIDSSITKIELRVVDITNLSEIFIDDLKVTSISGVPVPAAVWLFGTALIGFVGMSRRRKVA